MVLGRVLTFVFLSASSANGQPQPCPSNESVKGYLSAEALKQDLSKRNTTHTTTEASEHYELCPGVKGKITSPSPMASSHSNGILHENVLTSLTKNLESTGEIASSIVYEEIQELEEKDPGVHLWHEMNDEGRRQQHDRIMRRLSESNEWTSMTRETESSLLMSEYKDFLRSSTEEAKRRNLRGHQWNAK